MTNIEVAADAIDLLIIDDCEPDSLARAALAAIHPALPALTPDKVKRALDLATATWGPTWAWIADDLAAAEEGPE